MAFHISQISVERTCLEIFGAGYPEYMGNTTKIVRGAEIGWMTAVKITALGI
jgi:hypothetical protein